MGWGTIQFLAMLVEVLTAMSSKQQEQPYRANIAALWEYSNLCIALFGAQYFSEEGRRLYAEAGIDEEMVIALGAAGADGLLHTRELMSKEGQLLMQYWRSYDDLDKWARKLPHTRWWQWLRQNHDEGVGFYHEVYIARTAEAIYTGGMTPVGPAAFCSTEPAQGEDGRSKDRQRKFAQAGA